MCVCLRGISISSNVVCISARSAGTGGICRGSFRPCALKLCDTKFQAMDRYILVITNKVLLADLLYFEQT